MTSLGITPLDSLVRRIASQYSLIPQVEAVAMAGSRSTNQSDSQSDLDLYIYTRAEVPLGERARIAATNASRAEINNRLWEPGDKWVDAGTEVGVDVIFRDVEWIEEQLDKILRRHIPSIGYSTCFWHNILFSRVLYDREGWFTGLKQKASQPYPEELRIAIINKNYPVLRGNIFSYLHQLRLAVARDDLVSINHRVAAILASYFDILFAANSLPHPGEKQLPVLAERSCRKVPEEMFEQVSSLVRSVAVSGWKVVDDADKLIDGLDKLLKDEAVHPDSQ